MKTSPKKDMEFLRRKRKINYDYYETPMALVEVFKGVLRKYQNKSAVYIDPAIGDGRLFNVFPKNPRNIGIDIDTKRVDKLKSSLKKIENVDFLKYKLPKNLQTNMVVVAGNPPFSDRSGKNLYIKFIQHALSFANLCVFILPLSVKRWSAMDQIVKGVSYNIRCVKHIDVPDDCYVFSDYKDNEKIVKICIQVWARDGKIQNLPKIDKIARDFRLYSKSDSLPRGVSPDFYIRRVGTKGGVGCVYKNSELFGKNNPGADYAVVCNKGVNYVYKNLMNLHKNMKFKDAIEDRFSTSFPSLTKNDIYHIYNNKSYPRFEDYVDVIGS